jgi:hypothetical protein
MSVPGEALLRRASADAASTTQKEKAGKDRMTFHRWLAVAAAALVFAAPVSVAPAAEPTSGPLLEGPEVSPTFRPAQPAGDQIFRQPPTCVAFNVGVPDLNPGLELRAGLLYLQPGADNLGYAVLTNVKNPSSPHPVASPFWTVETLSPSYQPGFEVGARYALPSPGGDVQVNWQHLRTATSASVTAQQGLQWVSPFSQTGPSTAQTFDDLGPSQGVNKLRSAQGQVKFAFDEVDLDFGQHVFIGPSLQFRLFGGVSFARMREQLVSSFFGAPPGPDAEFPRSVPLSLSLDNASSFWGFGPRCGLDTTYEVGYGFHVAGQLAGALLIGRKQPSEYLFTATAPELAAIGIAVNRELIRSDSFTQVVYSVNARLGIGYCHSFCNGTTFMLEAGYMAAIFTDPFSAYETNNNVLPLQIGSLSTASMRHTLSAFTANGFYLTGGYRW